jgi:hypothetical protein
MRNFWIHRRRRAEAALRTAFTEQYHHLVPDEDMDDETLELFERIMAKTTTSEIEILIRAITGGQ